MEGIAMFLFGFTAGMLARSLFKDGKQELRPQPEPPCEDLQHTRAGELRLE